MSLKANYKYKQTIRRLMIFLSIFVCSTIILAILQVLPLRKQKKSPISSPNLISNTSVKQSQNKGIESVFSSLRNIRSIIKQNINFDSTELIEQLKVKSDIYELVNYMDNFYDNKLYSYCNNLDGWLRHCINISEDRYFERIINIAFQHLKYLVKIKRSLLTINAFFENKKSEMVDFGRIHYESDFCAEHNLKNVFDDGINDKDANIIRILFGNIYFGNFIEFNFKIFEKIKMNFIIFENKFNKNKDLLELTNSLFAQIRDIIDKTFINTKIEYTANNISKSLNLNIVNDFKRILRLIYNIISIVSLSVVNLDENNEVNGIIELIGRYLNNRNPTEYYIDSLYHLKRKEVEKEINENCKGLYNAIKKLNSENLDVYKNDRIDACFSVILILDK